jgi:hypothetical protein
MEPVQPCNTYHGVLKDKALWRAPDGKSAFKVYFVDIIGRSDRARTEWDLCGLGRGAFLDCLARTEGVEGVGFILAFPHITKAFRYGPNAETVLNVRAWRTRDMSPLDLARGEGYVEFACLAEALVAADEYKFWAQAQTVEDYLARWSPWREGAIARHDKLLAHWG